MKKGELKSEIEDVLLCMSCKRHWSVGWYFFEDKCPICEAELKLSIIVKETKRIKVSMRA